MANVRTISSVVFCAICLCGCARRNDKPSSNATTVPFIDKTGEALMHGDLFSDVRFIPLETTGESLMSVPQQVELMDSLIFVHDSHHLFVFRDDGKFVSQIGRRGRGPGEYLGIRGFFIDLCDRTVNIISPTDLSILTYDFDGTYLHNEVLPAELYDWGYFGMSVDDNKVLIFNSHNPGNNMAYTLMNRNNLTQVKYFNTYDPVKLEGYTYHFAKHPLTRSGSMIHYTMPLDPVIYEYSNGDVSEKYIIETPSKMIPKDIMQRHNGSYLNRLVGLTSDGYFGGFTDIFEVGEYLFIHYMAKPFYPGLFVLDKDSNIGSYHAFPSAEELLASPIFPFSASDGNRIISIVPSDLLISLKEYANSNVDMVQELHTTLSLIDINDNPIMVIYTPKPRP